MPTTALRTLIPLFDELRGERVLVRPYQESDAPAMHAAIAASREHIRPWLPFADEHQTVEESLDFIRRSAARWLLRDDMTVGIFDSATGDYVGGSGIHPRNWDIPSFEIGYWLRRSAEGHGYITEATRLLTDFAFDQLGAKRVMIRCDARNTRSAAVARRLGFLYEGTLRQSETAPQGLFRDMMYFSLIASDPRWPTAEPHG